MSKKDVKDEVLEKAFAEIEKKFGKGSIYFGGSNKKVGVVGFKSGIMAIDIASNMGGLPRGRIIELYGIESSGKTTATLLTIAEAQRRGEKCAFIDAEQAMDPKWAIRLGVNWGELIFAQPDTAEEAFGIIESLVRSGVVSIIALDSIASLVLKQETEEDVTDMGFPIKARMLSGAFRKLNVIMSEKKYTTLVCLNHRMEKIGKFGFGDKATTPGGKALKFYASCRLEFKNIGAITEKVAGEDDDEKAHKKKLGYKVEVKFIKNKCATPYGAACYNFLYEGGVDLIQEIIDLALQYKIISYNKKEREYSYNGEVIASGERRLKSYLKDIKNEKILSVMRDQISLKMQEVVPNSPSEEEIQEIEKQEKEEDAEKYEGKENE